MKQVLIVDIGTGGIHTCLVDAMGFLTGNAYEEIAYIHDPSINGYEFDALELFAMIKRSLSATLKKSSDVSSDIVALAVTSQRHGCVFLDADDRPLAAYPNVDARSEAESDLLKKPAAAKFTAGQPGGRTAGFRCRACCGSKTSGRNYTTRLPH